MARDATDGLAAAQVQQKLAALQARVDSLVHANLALASELWALTDRQIILEAVLSEDGNAIAERVDNHVPDQALKDRLDKRRGEFVDSVTTELAG